MSLPTVSVCMVVRDDLPFLKEALPAALEYADEVVVINNGSEDGTGEFLLRQEQTLGPARLSVHWADKSIIPEMGFSYLKNLAAQRAKCDWIHSLDSDEMLSAEQRPVLKHFLRLCRAPVVSIRTFTFKGDIGEHQPTEWDWIANNCKWDDMTHRRIYRRDAGILWKGYIHEELYQGELNAMAICQGSDFKHLHYSNYRTWGDQELKRARYAWMLKRAFHKPALQDYTNRWWYDHYFPENRAELEQWAARYEEMVAGGKA